MQIRPATAPDRPGIEAVIGAAFGDEAPSIIGMVRALDESAATRATLVAVQGHQDGQVVGHVQLSRSWLDTRRALVEVLTLSPLSVAPDVQGRGTGTALIAAALQEAERQAAPAVFVEGAWTYYGRRGFAPAVPLGFGRPSTRIPEPAFQVALLSGHQDWMVGALVYPEAIWANDCVGLRDPLLGRIEAELRR